MLLKYKVTLHTNSLNSLSSSLCSFPSLCLWICSSSAAFVSAETPLSLIFRKTNDWSAKGGDCCASWWWASRRGVTMSFRNSLPAIRANPWGTPTIGNPLRWYPSGSEHALISIWLCCSDAGETEPLWKKKLKFSKILFLSFYYRVAVFLLAFGGILNCGCRVKHSFGKWILLFVTAAGCGILATERNDICTQIQTQISQLANILLSSHFTRVLHLQN